MCSGTNLKNLMGIRVRGICYWIETGQGANAGSLLSFVDKLVLLFKGKNLNTLVIILLDPIFFNVLEDQILIT